MTWFRWVVLVVVVLLLVSIIVVLVKYLKRKYTHDEA
jgi:hypothetical protein